MSKLRYAWLVIRNEEQMINLSAKTIASKTAKTGSADPDFVRVRIPAAHSPAYIRIRGRISELKARSGGVLIEHIRHQTASTGNLHTSTTESTWESVAEAEAWANMPENGHFFEARTDAFIVAVGFQTE